MGITLLLAPGKLFTLRLKLDEPENGLGFTRNHKVLHFRDLPLPRLSSPILTTGYKNRRKNDKDRIKAALRFHKESLLKY
jgi:hypothetical protein